jgi:hypothetical protein
MISFISFILENAFNDAKNKWYIDNDKKIVDDYIDRFKFLKSKNKIYFQKDRDISNWINFPFSDFKERVDEYIRSDKRESEERELQNKVKFIFENDKFKVIKPLNSDSMVKYGRGTKWCITSPFDETRNKWWNEYIHDQDITLYVILKKKSDLKYAVMMYPNGIFKILNNVQSTKSEDAAYDFLKERKIPLNIFVKENQYLE